MSRRYEGLFGGEHRKAYVPSYIWSINVSSLSTIFCRSLGSFSRGKGASVVEERCFRVELSDDRSLAMVLYPDYLGRQSDERLRWNLDSTARAPSYFMDLVYNSHNPRFRLWPITTLRMACQASTLDA